MILCTAWQEHSATVLWCLAASQSPVDVLESAPMTTPPSKLAAIIVVPMDTGCGRADGMRSVKKIVLAANPATTAAAAKLPPQQPAQSMTHPAPSPESSPAWCRPY